MIGQISRQSSGSRRFLNADGTFGGVVVASLNPDHFNVTAEFDLHTMFPLL